MMESQKTLVGDMESLLQFKQQILMSLASALTFMRGEFKLERRTDGKPNSGGWSQFLSEEIRPPTVTGTSCIISAMIVAGEGQHSEYIAMGKRLIVEHSRDDGGWSKPSLDRYHSLTLITCLAMRALLDADQPLSSNSIRNSVQWLLEAQNPDGGWGNLARDTKSDVTSTAYALRVLTRTVPVHPDVGTAMERGHRWLVGRQNNDYSWSRESGKSGSLPYVSHAVDGLLACGVHPSSLLPVREWASSNIPEGVQFIDNYSVILPNGETERLIWTHLTDERSLITLLKLGVDITVPEVNLLVRRILDHQVDGKHWRVDTLPNTAPVWAIVEAVLALHLYLDLLECQRINILSRAVSKSQDIIQDHSERIANLESQMATVSLKAKLMQWLGLRGGERQAQEKIA